CIFPNAGWNRRRARKLPCNGGARFGRPRSSFRAIMAHSGDNSGTVSLGFRLGILLIIAAAPLFAATPNLGPEVAMDVPQPGPVSAGSRSVAVASNGRLRLSVILRRSGLLATPVNCANA